MTKKKDDNAANAQPDFEQAAKIMLGEITGSGDKRAKMNGDLSAAWKRVEDGCHVDKRAAKDALKIARMSDEMQSEYLRSFIGLMAPLSISIRRDLVDLAEGVEGLMIPVTDAPESELS